MVPNKPGARATGMILGLVLLFVVTFALAAQDKQDTKKPDFITKIGNFESYKNETLKLTKVDGEDKEYKVPGDTLVAYGADEGKPKVVKAKDYLKDVKKGWIVSVTLTPDGKKVLALGVTDPSKQKPKEDEEKKGK